MGAHLGQHFLTSQRVISSILHATDLDIPTTILEIGPGKGILTERLLENGHRVVAVEKDSQLVPYLSQKFGQSIKDSMFTLIHGDIRSFRVEEHISEPYVLVANIPYYITGTILRTFLSEAHQPKSMTLLVQKEVAERVCARDGKESILSLSVKAYGTPYYVKTVSRKAFSPPPKVDSAILSITDISRAHFKNKEHEERFFALVKEGFSHKRKMLRNNLSSLLKKEDLENAFIQCTLQKNVRAENLSLQDWKCLTEDL